MKPIIKRFSIAAIDPMALLLPPDVYQKIVEGPHPHEPKEAEIEKIFEKMTPAERTSAVENANILISFGKAVEKVAAKIK